jgi:hypothetical protein
MYRSCFVRLCVWRDEIHVVCYFPLAVCYLIASLALPQLVSLLGDVVDGWRGHVDRLLRARRIGRKVGGCCCGSLLSSSSLRWGVPDCF